MSIALIKQTLRGVEGRSAGYENRGHSPAIEGVRHHIDNGTPTLRPPSERHSLRCTTHYSPCCCGKAFKGVAAGLFG